MVSFIADPRIAQSQEQRQLSLAKMLQGYQPPANPYGYTPAGYLEPLAHALSARLAGKQASEFQTAQQGAQSQVLAALLSKQRGTPGAQQYAPINVAFPAHPGATQSLEQRVAIDDAGAEIDPSVLKAAGLLEGEYDIAAHEAELAGQEISEANRIKYATQRLNEAESPEERRRWFAEIDAIAAAERQIGVEEDRAKEERKARSDMKPVIRISDGESVYVSAAELKHNKELYKKISPEVSAKELVMRKVMEKGLDSLNEGEKQIWALLEKELSFVQQILGSGSGNNKNWTGTSDPLTTPNRE
jgi:hypothetical protein